MDASTLLCFCWIAVAVNSVPIRDKEEAALYLQKFGYLGGSYGDRAGASLSADAVSNAIKYFQRFAGLNQTGELDNSTITMMKTPRCGVKDSIGNANSLRKKRYALQGSKWRETQLTYHIIRYPTRVRDRRAVNNEIARAFKTWSDVTNLNIEERKRGRVSIKISFESGEHGDENPFDGPGNILAHSYFPKYGGDVHFDDDEKWTIDGESGTNLFQVAAHEFGHSLGLSHSDERRALMSAFYLNESTFNLHSDDILGIQALYGSNGSPGPPAVPAEDEKEPLRLSSDTSDAPDLCQDASINAATRTQDGSTYVFKGEYYWKTLSNGIADGYPRRISEDWGGLEGNLDAALTWANGKTFFFKGGRYWRFTNREMLSGYPKLLNRGFDGIPDNLDAALVWGGNGKTYFFKGSQYWRFDSNNEPPVSDEYPKAVTEWKGLPADGIDAAVKWENGLSYFFKGQNYYRFNDTSSEVDPGYPVSTAVYWFDCKSPKI